ncbi:MAG: hypothetical protein Q7S71_04790 [Candidatus Nitrotoga sp.]|nr:hypothetical protein [Candidatus Nitrotoga sp.]
MTNYNFFSANVPTYLPDDKQFIFSAEAPSEFGGLKGSDARKAYKKQYGDNTIFIRNDTETPLSPLFIKRRSSGTPNISRDGTRIVYVGDVEKEDGIKTRYAYDLFLFENGAHKRITQFRSYILSVSLSWDGQNVVFVTDSPEGIFKNIRNYQLWQLNIKTGAVNQLHHIEDALSSIVKH